MHDITSVDAMTYRDALLTQGRSYKSNEGYLAVLQFFKWCQLMNYCDHLGSVDTLMHARTGAVLQHRGYDVFGRPRDIASGNALLTSWQGVTKGYTDHEHLVDQELIHMNGRIYGFNIGRFLSVDPFLQFPENSQSANPYSYILNNPMRGTDPTGYLAETDKAEAVGGPSNDAEVEKEGAKVKGNGKKNETRRAIRDHRSASKAGTFAPSSGTFSGVSNGTNVDNSDSSNTKSSFNSGEHKGRLEGESTLGEAPSDANQVYNDAEKASRELPEIRRGKGREFVVKFAISYIDKSGEIKVETFLSFKNANDFAGQVDGGWPEAMDQGGYITLYRTSIYAKTIGNKHNSYQKLDLSNKESVIYNLAHEGVHTQYGRSHDARLEAISFGAVESYRKNLK